MYFSLQFKCVKKIIQGRVLQKYLLKNQIEEVLRFILRKQVRVKVNPRTA